MNKRIFIISSLLILTSNAVQLRGQQAQIQDDSILIQQVDSQEKQLKSGNEADVFVFNKEGNAEFIGKAGSSDVQEHTDKAFRKSLRKMVREQQKVQPNEQNVVDEVPQLIGIPEPFKLNGLENQDVAPQVIRDSDMNDGSRAQTTPQVAPQQAQQSSFQVKLQPALVVPYQLTFTETITHLFDEVDVSSEEMNSQDCIYVFSQCNYQGVSLSSCASNPTAISQFPYPVASVFIPANSALTVNNDQTTIMFRDSIPCLKNPVHFALIKAKVTLEFSEGQILID